MSEIVLVATLTPAQGKADRVQELLEAMTRKVQAEEPGVLRYHLHRQVVDGSSTPVFVMLETYKDEQAYKNHGKTSHMKELGSAFQAEGLLTKPFDIVRCAPVAGFASRL